MEFVSESKIIAKIETTINFPNCNYIHIIKVTSIKNHRHGMKVLEEEIAKIHVDEILKFDE